MRGLLVFEIGLLALVAGGGVAGCASTNPAMHSGSTAQLEQGSSDRIFDLPYLMRDLDNGLRVIVVKTDYPDVVTIQIPVSTGSRNEVEPGKSGFAHFFEHMMFRGTKNYPPEVYGEILKNAGADQNAYTTDDYTNYHITFTKADLEKVIELEADRFKNLSYTEDQFRTEALAVKGEYLKSYSNPMSRIFERMRDRAFTTHTYKHTTMGFIKDIEDMPNQLEYARTFFDRWYRPQNATVILVGDLEPERAFNLVKQYWGDWKPGSYTVEIPQEPAPTGPIEEHIEWAAPTQPWIVVSFRGPQFSANDKSMPSLDLVSQLFFSRKSELYRKLVIKDRLVDQLFPMFANRKDPYLLTVAARLTKVENATQVRDAMLETFAKARTQRVTLASLSDAKNRLKYGFVQQMDNSGSIGGILARFVQIERTPETINELYRTYDRVSPTDLLRYSNEFFTDNGRIIVTLSNDATMPGLGKAPLVDTMAAQRAGGRAVNLKLVEMPGQSPLIDVSFLFRAGAADDPPGKHGLAALTAAMITDGGSEARTIDEINESLYPLAAGFGAQVDKEMLLLAGSVHRDNLEAWYDTMREQLLTPGWRQEDFDRIKTRTVNAIQTNLVGNNDEELGKEMLYSYIFGPSHPYGSLSLGSVADLESITLDDVKAFYARFLTPENLTVGLAGGYTSELVDRLKSDLSGLPRGSRDRLVLPSPPAIHGHQAIIVEKETPAVAVSFGFPIEVKRGDPDWVALWLARSWLGEHRNSSGHLYKRIRETRGMNYGDYAYIEYFPRGMFQFHPDANLGRQQQIFQVWIRPLRTNNDAHFATRAAMYELDQLINQGLSQEDFEATRNYLSKYVSQLVKTQSKQLGYKLDSDYYDVETFADYVRQELNNMTVEQVNRVIKKHLQTENVKFIFVTRDAKDLRQRLVSDQGSPLTYNSPKPDLEVEDKVIAGLKLGFGEDAVKIMPAAELFK